MQYAIQFIQVSIYAIYNTEYTDQPVGWQTLKSYKKVFLFAS